MLRRSMSLLQTRREHYQAKLGFYLFLASLGMFFLASMIGYAIIATASVKPSDVHLRLPLTFLPSTLILIGVSFVLHRAVENVHHERQLRFRRCLIAALILSFAFCLVQCFGLNELISVHSRWGGGQAKLYGISFTLALVHALHVVGGLFFLWFVTVRGMHDAYDHERHYAVDLCATYWHFLDGVWIAMLATFLITSLGH